MPIIYDNNANTIGNTPLVRLNKVINKKDVTVFAKVESRNPAFSVKCRIGAAMIEAGEKSGKIRPGTKIVEPTSGNTGIALAFTCAAKGYDLTLTMPDTMSIERRKVLKAFGAKLVLTPGAEGMKGAINKAQEMFDADPENVFIPQQFENPANPEIHYRTTGPEIFQDTSAKVDYFFAGVGTGGTISGTSRYLKKLKGLDLTTIAVEPVESPVITQALAEEDLTPGPHKIQGIGAGFIPANLDLDLIDGVQQVTSDEAVKMARRLACEEGILCGISSGAAVAAVNKWMEERDLAGKVVVVILPDGGERYLSSVLFEDIEA